MAFAKALPQTLTSLNLSGNYLWKKTEGELTQLLNGLPFNVETVVIDDETYYRDSYLVNQLLRKVSDLITKRNKDGLVFNAISLPVEIDETCLNRIIPLFEKQKTPIAFLICGLLLEGQISTITNEKYSPLEYKEYMEQRTHDAISFYTKAALDSSTRPLVEFLLWELKLTCTLPSIQHRLSEYDLTPTYASHTFNQINHKQEPIKSHLIKELGLFSSSQDSNQESAIKSITILGL